MLLLLLIDCNTVLITTTWHYISSQQKNFEGVFYGGNLGKNIQTRKAKRNF
jgi:hypothetical protein